MFRTYDVYLSGAITNADKDVEEKNRARFTEKAEELRALGLSVYNPIEGVLERDYLSGKHTYEEILIYDLQLIAKERLRTVYLMRGWEQSHGAKLEKALGELLGIRIVYEK